MMKKMFNEIRSCNPMTYVFKEYVKIVKGNAQFVQNTTFGL